MYLKVSLLQTLLVVLLLSGVGLSASVIFSADTPYGDMITMSADGKTVVVMATKSNDKIFVFKRIALTYHKIEVKNFSVWVGWLDVS